MIIASSRQSSWVWKPWTWAKQLILLLIDMVAFSGYLNLKILKLQFDFIPALQWFFCFKFLFQLSNGFFLCFKCLSKRRIRKFSLSYYQQYVIWGYRLRSGLENHKSKMGNIPKDFELYQVFVHTFLS